VQLAPAGAEIVGEAMTLAWQLRVAKNQGTRRKAAAPRTIKATTRKAAKKKR
jgi:hypothetical protein